MTIQQLKYFLKVCDSGSVTKAAQELYLSHQALSKSIRSLEQELSCQLFRRSGGALVLTRQGQLLRDRSRGVVEEFDRFHRGVLRSIGKPEDTLDICVFEEGMFYYFTLEDVERFHRLYPRYHLEVEERPYRICNRMLERGDVDAAITLEPVQGGSMTVIPLAVRERVVVMRRDDPLTGKELLSMEDLKDRSMVLSMNEKDYGMLHDLCRQCGFEPKIVQRLVQVSSMLESCSMGNFLGLIPDMYVYSLLPRYPDLTVRRFADNQFPFPIFLCLRENREKSGVLDAFTDYLRSLPIPRSRGAE